MSRFGDNSSEKSRATVTPDSWEASRLVTPDACHWCRNPFGVGRMRYPIMDGVNFGSGWELVSICMDCFKHADDATQVFPGIKRYQRACTGCGEPIYTITGRNAKWETCSRRCYLRAYRTRRRANGGSAIAWKQVSPRRSCNVCKQEITSKRADALFCSYACRQRQHRQRQGEATA